ALATLGRLPGSADKTRGGFTARPRSARTRTRCVRGLPDDRRSDLVAVAPDGPLAGCCIAWLKQATGSGGIGAVPAPRSGMVGPPLPCAPRVLVALALVVGRRRRERLAASARTCCAATAARA